MGIHIGLDFGTSNSGIAVFDGREVRLLPLEKRSSIPEVVRTILYITRDYHASIGQEAVELYYKHNVNRQRHYVKQWAGEIDYSGADLHYVRDVYVYVDELKPGRLLQYLKTALRKSTPGGYEGTQVFERFYTVGELVRAYLEILKKKAEAELGEPIRTVTIGRPVHFSDSPERDRQSQETLHQAAMEAGFEKVSFELEPVAAALYYEQSISAPQNVIIFDFGGGTLDIAVMRLGEPGRREIFASNGVDIAGSDFDRAIIENRLLPHFGLGQISHQPEILELIHSVPDWISLPDLATPQNKNLLEHAIREGLAPVRLKALQALIYNDLAFTFYNRVETSKINLSEHGASVIDLEDRGIPLWEMYTRSQFEQDIHDYQVRIEKVLMDTLAASGLEPGSLDAVVKTGGSSNIPLFDSMLKRIFGKQKVKASNAFSSVVAGLAIRASGGAIL